MRYWNCESFESLKEIADAFVDRPGFEAFAEYCLLKERGLRSDSLKAISKFIKHVEVYPQDQQQEVVAILCRLIQVNTRNNLLLSYPLVEYLTHALEAWIALTGERAELHRWLGLLTNNHEHYEVALRIDPMDQFALDRVCSGLIDEVNYQTHHLNESSFIGKVATATDALNRAQVLVQSIEEPQSQAAIQKNIDYYKRLIEAWQLFQSDNNSTDFPKWCQERNLELFHFPSRTYIRPVD